MSTMKTEDENKEKHQDTFELLAFADQKELPQNTKFQDLGYTITQSKLYNYIVFSGNHPKLIKQALNLRSNFVDKESSKETFEGINFIWKPTPFSHLAYQKIDKINAFRNKGAKLVINHLDNLQGITRKTGLIKSLKRYYKLNRRAINNSYEIFDTTPTTFLIIAGCEDSHYYAFLKRFKQLVMSEPCKERMPLKHCKQNLWLVKPAAMNQGKGIEIFNNLNEIRKFLNSRKAQSFWIIQKYIEHPLLFFNRKFDIRMWACITSNNELYFYKEGYIRTSSEVYKLDSKENYVHLTNQCLQVHSKNYGLYEEGNTISFSDFKKYLIDTYPEYANKFSFEGDLIARMKDIIIDTYLSIKNEINPNRRSNSFELLGYDFMIDEDFRIWLIEVNANPYLGAPTKHIEQLLPNMINDLFQIVVDPILPPKTKIYSSMYNNKFELLFSERNINGKCIRLNKRRSYKKSVYPIKELMPLFFKQYFENHQTNLTEDEKIPILQNKTISNFSIKVQYSSLMSDEKSEDRSNKLMSLSNERSKEKEGESQKSTSSLKTFSNQMNNLINKHNDELFKLLTEKLSNRFINYESLSESEKEQCIEFINNLKASKHIILLTLSRSFQHILTITLNISNNLPNNMRESALNLLEMVSRDKYLRNDSLYKRVTIHPLIKILMMSIEKYRMYSMKIKIQYIYTAARILIYLAWLDRSSYYISGENIDKNRHYFTMYGGLLSLIDTAFNSSNTQIRQFCKEEVLSKLSTEEINTKIKLRQREKIRGNPCNMFERKKSTRKLAPMDLPQINPSIAMDNSPPKISKTYYKSQKSLNNSKNIFMEEVSNMKKATIQDISHSSSDSCFDSGLGSHGSSQAGSSPNLLKTDTTTISPSFPQVLIQRIQANSKGLLDQLHRLLAEKLKSYIKVGKPTLGGSIKKKSKKKDLASILYNNQRINRFDVYKMEKQNDILIQNRPPLAKKTSYSEILKYREEERRLKILELLRLKAVEENRIAETVNLKDIRKFPKFNFRDMNIFKTNKFRVKSNANLDLLQRNSIKTSRIEKVDTIKQKEVDEEKSQSSIISSKSIPLTPHKLEYYDTEDNSLSTDPKRDIKPGLLTKSQFTPERSISPLYTTYSQKIPHITNKERIGKLRTPQIIFPGCVQKSNEPVHKFPTEIISNFSSEIYAKRKQILFPSGTKRKHLTKGADRTIMDVYSGTISPVQKKKKKIYQINQQTI